MNDELIHDLVRDLTPVTRLASPDQTLDILALRPQDMEGDALG